jgi:hypothetical protein
LQSFGRYQTQEEAARAYDLGSLIALGHQSKQMKINFPVSDYVDDQGYLRPEWVRTVPKVEKLSSGSVNAPGSE